MSPTAAAEFTKNWPLLERRLRSFLAAKRVAPCDIDDLVQETAARLLSVWSKVDPGRPLWALTVTIALNLVRDRRRKPDVEVLCDPPEREWTIDAERAGLARMELGKVLRAMADLTESQRAALIQVVEPGFVSDRTEAADKMLRMRARRRLANAIGRASAGLAIKLRRVGDALHGLLTKGEGVTQALACATCLFVTTAGAGALYPAMDAEAQELTAVGASLDHEITATTSQSDVLVTRTISSEDIISPRAGATATTAESARSGRRGDKGSDGGGAASGTDGVADPSLSLPSASLPGGDAPLPGAPTAPDQPADPTDQAQVDVDGTDPSGDAPIQAPVELPVATVDELADDALGDD